MSEEIVKVNPRLVNGVLTWNEGDTFYIKWKVSLLKESLPYEYDEKDQLVVRFYKKWSKCEVYSFIEKHIGTSKTIFLDFTEDVTQFFKAGEYSYSLQYMRDENGRAEVITLGSRFPVEVLPCR